MSNKFNSEDKIKNLSENLDDFEQCLIEAGQTHRLVMHKTTLLCFLIMSVIIIIFAVPKSYFYKADKIVDSNVNSSRAPIMYLISDNIDESNRVKQYGSNKLIKMKNLNKTETFYILPLARYSLSGRMTAKNRFFLNQTKFDKLALIDIGMVWGVFSKDEYFDKLSSNTSELTDGSRQLNVYFTKRYEREYAKMIPYLNSHFSHTHIIPANKRIMRALSSLRVGESVQLDGYLVDIFDSNKHRFAMTSLSLTDYNESSRGYGEKQGGACEIMYVMRVQIRNKVFE